MSDKPVSYTTLDVYKRQLRQRTENKSLSLSGRQSKGEDSGENRDTGHHGGAGVESRDGCAGLRNILALFQIAAIRKRNAHAQAQRVEHLSQSRGKRTETELALRVRKDKRKAQSRVRQSDCLLYTSSDVSSPVLCSLIGRP